MGRFFKFVIDTFWKYPRAAVGAIASLILGETARDFSAIFSNMLSTAALLRISNRQSGCGQPI